MFMRNMTNNKFLIISSVLLVFFFLSVSNTNAVNSYVPPYILNLYNASYYVTNNTYTVNETTIQNITGACGTGFVLQNVSNGVFQCVAVSSGGGSGTVTSIVFRNGFNQTTITTSGTVDLNYTAVQQRVNESCASGSSIRVINLDGSVTCETDSSGSGTVTSVATGYGLYGGTITTSGTLYVNLTELTTNFGNWSEDKPNYATINYVLGVNNLSYSQIASNIGNWSADKSSYATISYVNAVNNVSLSTIQGLINANGNYSQDANAIYTNITNLQTSSTEYYTNITNLQISNTSLWSWITDLYNNVTSLFTSNTTTNSRIDSLNTTKSGIGDCPSGQFVQNLTTGAPECFTPVSSGGVSDGDKGDITVSSSGAIWLLDNSTNYDIQKYNPIWYSDFIRGNGETSPTGNGLYIFAISSGTVDYPSNSGAYNTMIDNNHPGIVQVRSSTTQNSGYGFGTRNSASQVYINLTGNEVTEMIFYTANATNNTMRFGWHNSATSANPTKGIYFEMLPNTTLANPIMYIYGRANNSGVVTTATSYPLYANKWYRLELVTTGNGLGLTNAQYNIYNSTSGDTSLLWSENVSYKMPSQLLNWQLVVTKQASVASSIIDLDWLAMYWNKTLVR